MLLTTLQEDITPLEKKLWTYVLTEFENLLTVAQDFKDLLYSMQ